jgi:ATP-dependent DNA helicase RecQ
VTLCDGCHAARHPHLQAGLARRTLELWGVRIARLFDREHSLPAEAIDLGPAMRLFGADRLREGQLEPILAALRGESVLVVRATGGGKSLCFQLPSVLRPGTAFVLSPLRALMTDQVRGLQRKAVPSTFINSDCSATEKKLRYELLEAGALKLVYLTPERFDDQMVRAAEIERLVAMRPSFLIVDEAHCIDRWGDDFRPAYSQIAEVRRRLGDPRVLAFTATAGVSMQRRIMSSLGIDDGNVLVHGVDRPNIALARHATPQNQARRRAELIAGWLGELEYGGAMIFVPTRRIGEALRSDLESLGHDVPFYHSQLPTNQRQNLQARFTGDLEPKVSSIICTSAFGMGIDVPDASLVVNWQHPASVEDYLQEFGRAGRDGESSLAILFTDAGRDDGLLEFMAKKTAEQAVTKRGGSIEELVAKKKERIAEMKMVALEPTGYLRRALNTQLIDGPRPNRRERARLSDRIIRWVFSEKATHPKAPDCCDVCSRELATAVATGHLPWWLRGE